MAFSITHPVKLFPQPTGMTCWSAAATMLFGDRSIGPGRAALDPSGGLGTRYADIRQFAASHGLQMHPLQSWSVEGLVSILRRGPLWVGGAVPTTHAYVISAIFGDGTPEGTMITIHDPWPPNRGRIYTVSYGKWMSAFPLAAVYILQR